MYVDAKFILPGSVKLQHQFAACSQRLKSPLNVTMSVTVCLDGWSTTILSASYTQGCLFAYVIQQVQKSDICSWAIPTTAPCTPAILSQTIWNAVSLSGRFSQILEYKMSTGILLVHIKYFMCYLICDVISCCVTFLQAEKIVIENQNKRAKL